MTRGRPLDLCSADYVLDLFLPSFILRWFARASSSLSVLLHLLREANPLDSRSYIRALTGERIVRANRTSCARRRGHTPRSLFVIRPQQSAGSLSRLNVYVVREKKEQRMDREREREKRCQDVLDSDTAITRGKFLVASSIRGFDLSPNRAIILSPLRRKSPSKIP